MNVKTGYRCLSRSCSARFGTLVAYASHFLDECPIPLGDKARFLACLMTASAAAPEEPPESEDGSSSSEESEDGNEAPDWEEVLEETTYEIGQEVPSQNASTKDANTLQDSESIEAPEAIDESQALEEPEEETDSIKVPQSIEESSIEEPESMEESDSDEETGDPEDSPEPQNTEECAQEATSSLPSSEELADESSLDTEMEQLHECPDCAFVTEKEHSFLTHRKSARRCVTNRLKEWKGVCRYCNRDFTKDTPARMYFHLAMVTKCRIQYLTDQILESTSPKCPCGFTSDDLNELRAHLTSDSCLLWVPISKEDSPNTCDNCGKNAWYYELGSHVKICKGPRVPKPTRRRIRTAFIRRIKTEMESTAEEVQQNESIVQKPLNESISKKIRHTCSFCERSFNRKGRVQSHMLQCSQAPETEKEPTVEQVSSVSVVKNPQNESIIEKPRYPCSYCGKTFSRNSYTQEHKRRCSQAPQPTAEAQNESVDSSRVPCSYCQKTYSRSDKAQEHMRRCPLAPETEEANESVDSSRVPCAYCDKSYSRSDKAQEHMRRCPLAPDGEALPRESCPYCQKSYSRMDKVERHVITCPLAPALDPVVCDLCHKELLDLNKMRRHATRSCETSKTFDCPFCPGSFANSYRLNRHVQKSCPLAPETTDRFDQLLKSIEQ